MSSSEAAPDLCVIGGSEAGLAACMGAVALGLSCVLVDDGDPSGRSNPDLALAALSHAAADHGRHAGAWSAVGQALAQAAPERRHARFAAMNVRLVRGTGRFADAATVMAGDTAIRARRFFIATGGRQPARRLADGLSRASLLGVSDLARLDHAPGEIMVVGGGPQAVSAAQSLARLGSRVTLVATALLPGVDPELAAPFLIRLRRDGVVLRRAMLHMVRGVGGGIEASLSDGTTARATHLLLADDSHPALDALDLASAGVATRGAQELVLDAALRSSRRHIFALGRAAGARSSAEGVAQAGHALRAAFLHVPGRFRSDRVPTVTATEPQVATVGRSTADGSTQIWRWPLAQTGGGALLGLTEGQVKVSTDRRGRVLGAGLVGSQVRDLVPFWTLAVAQGLTLAQLGTVAAPTPSLSESARALAVQDLGRRLGAPWVRRVLQAARWLG